MSVKCLAQSKFSVDAGSLLLGLACLCRCFCFSFWEMSDPFLWAPEGKNKEKGPLASLASILSPLPEDSM